MSSKMIHLFGEGVQGSNVCFPFSTGFMRKRRPQGNSAKNARTEWRKYEASRRPVLALLAKRYGDGIWLSPVTDRVSFLLKRQLWICWKDRLFFCPLIEPNMNSWLFFPHLFFCSFLLFCDFHHFLFYCFCHLLIISNFPLEL